MTQAKLQALHNYAMTQIQLYASGLITLVELQNALKSIKLGDVGGLVDPATGLRFP
jgi:hypothetical protein